MSHGMKFEDEVRRLARARWNLAGGNGGQEFINRNRSAGLCGAQLPDHGTAILTAWPYPGAKAVAR